VLARLLATATAVALLLVRPQHPDDTTFAVVALVYGLGSTALAALTPRVRSAGAAWAADIAAVLLLILLAGEWRSPFYLLALTALILPSTQLGFGRALLTGSLFTLAYVGVAFVTGLTPGGLDSTERLESLATHVLMPILVSFLFAYATKLLRRLEGERERSERLAVETERRRIAWELHDSSKQRVHAAHLVLSQLPDRLEGATRRAVESALSELANATTVLHVRLRRRTLTALQRHPPVRLVLVTRASGHRTRRSAVRLH
jgi:signal transduction histidine kinase